MLIQVETTQVINSAIDARIAVTQDKSRRAFVLRLLLKELEVEIKAVQGAALTLYSPSGKNALLPGQGAVIKRGAARHAGDAKAILVAEDEGKPVDTVRQYSNTMIKHFYEMLIACEEIPENTLWRYFLLGWRGKYGQVVREHGQYISYSKGCRCKPCSDAWRIYQRGYYKKRRKKLLARRSLSVETDLADRANLILDSVHTDEMQSKAAQRMAERQVVDGKADE